VTQTRKNWFEQNPKISLTVLLLVILALVYGAFSIKWINNAYTEHRSKNIKTVIRQYHASSIIDHNIGRFIKLREHKPNTIKKERPTRNYLRNIEPNSLERKYYVLRTDEHGFIKPSNIHATPDIKIVFLGGSTTECLYMDEEQRFPYLVGRQLEKIGHKKVNVYNGGVSANESKHSINILLNKVLAMHPDVVVMMHNINDLIVLRTQGGYDYSDSVKSHLQTSKNVFTQTVLPKQMSHLTEAQMSELFKRNLELFVTICKLHHIKPVLMTQANRVSKEDILYHQFNENIRQIADKHQIEIIDLAKKIPASERYFYDSYHFNVQGAQLVSEVISEQLAKIF